MEDLFEYRDKQAEEYRKRIKALCRQVERKNEYIAELEALAVRLYNAGYAAGHNDTVEGCYTDIHSDDADTYHADVVSEIMDGR